MSKLVIGFIKANWHDVIVNQTLVGFEADMKAADQDVQIDIFEAPGAFEMPLIAKKLGQKGGYNAIVAAALVVDGGIYRHDFVAQAVVSGLMQVQLETGVPTLSVSLTPHHFQPCIEHTNFYFDHYKKKGAEAAQAVRMLAALKI